MNEVYRHVQIINSTHFSDLDFFSPQTCLWDKILLKIDPLDAMGICLNKQKLKYYYYPYMNSYGLMEALDTFICKKAMY